MAYALGYPEIDDSDFAAPIVDHLHERQHRRQSLIQYLTHRKANLSPIINQPDVDIRDADKEYFIDVELPGVGNKEAITIEWTSNRDLYISGDVDRPSIPEDSIGHDVHKKSVTAETGTRDTTTGEWIPPRDPHPKKPTLLAAERKVGPFRRHFTFPLEVDMEQLKAKLDNGLLVIRVPKRVNAKNTGRVRIE